MADWNWDDLKPKKPESKLKRKIREANEKDSLSRSVSHSSLYHRYFEDYSETRVTLPNGKSRIQRVYVGAYYSRQCSDTAWILIKALYCLLYAAALCCQIIAMTRDAYCNRVWFTAVPGLVSTIPSLILFATIISCIVSRRQMPVYNYNLFMRLTRMSIITGCFLGAYSIAVIIFAIVYSAYFSFANSLIPLLLGLASCVLYLSIAIIESRAQYEKSANKRKPNENGVVIS